MSISNAHFFIFLKNSFYKKNKNYYQIYILSPFYTHKKSSKKIYFQELKNLKFC